MNKILVVLTLERHRHGVWITRLLEALEQQQKQQLLTKGESSPPWTTVQVVALESIFPMDPNTTFESIILQQQSLSQQQQRLGNEEEETQNNTNNNAVVVGVINRVSDAAPPDLAQLCTALLQLAATASPRIPIFNGPTSYSLCTNKWCHHALFRQANLSCPATRVILNLPVVVEQQQQQQDDKLELEETDTTTSTPTPQQQRRLLQYRQQIKQASKQLLEHETQQQQQLPLLIKPNGGGFGAGIVRLSTLTDVDQLELPQGGGGDAAAAASIQLVQAYQAPQDQYIYRIWLLCGHVQCAIRRRITSTPPPQEPAPDATTTQKEEVSTPKNSEFTSGCAGGSACAWKPKGKLAAATTTATRPLGESPFEIWQVSKEVRRELEEQLIPILPRDFHAGSVEFLYDTATTTTTANSIDDANLKASRNRLYFDLNLLSTLPVGAQEQQLLLQSHQDVWAELAVAIATVVSSTVGA